MSDYVFDIMATNQASYSYWNDKMTQTRVSKFFVCKDNFFVIFETKQ